MKRRQAVKLEIGRLALLFGVQFLGTGGEPTE